MGDESRHKFGSASKLASGRQNASGRMSTVKLDRDKNFIKRPLNPSIFKINVHKKHLAHLHNDDLDEISKNEVIYKVLKDQLRDHQKLLINLKLKAKKAANQTPKRDGGVIKKDDLKDFAQKMKNFEFHGS